MRDVLCLLGSLMVTTSALVILWMVLLAVAMQVAGI
jgi:hypothetical protein